MSGETSVLEAVDLARHYQVKRGMFKGEATVRALTGASFSLAGSRQDPGRGR